jgi:hypothetical protein
LGGGIGLVAVGVPLAVGSALAPVPLGAQRRNDGAAVAGSVLIGLAAGAAGVGTAFVAATGFAPEHTVDTAHYGTAFVVSAGLLAVGVPLLAFGARTESDDERSERMTADAQEHARDRDPTWPKETRSPFMVGVGGSLTAIGCAGVVAGAIAMGGLSTCGDCGLGAVAVGGGTMTAGSIFLGIGIPLLAVGATQVPVDPAAAAPRVRIGPGGMEVAWTLD